MKFSPSALNAAVLFVSATMTATRARAGPLLRGSSSANLSARSLAAAAIRGTPPSTSLKCHEGADDCEHPHEELTTASIRIATPSESPSTSPPTNSSAAETVDVFQQPECRPIINDQECDATHPMPAFCDVIGNTVQRGCCPLNVWTHWEDGADDCEYPYKNEIPTPWYSSPYSSDIYLSVPTDTHLVGIERSLNGAIQDVTNFTAIYIHTNGGNRGPRQHVGKMDCDDFPSAQNGRDYSDRECYLVQASLDLSGPEYPTKEQKIAFVAAVEEAKFDGSLEGELFTVHKIASGSLYASVAKSSDFVTSEDVFDTIVDDLEDYVDDEWQPNDDGLANSVLSKILAPTPEQYPTVAIAKGFSPYGVYGQVDCGSVFLPNYYDSWQNKFWEEVYGNMGTTFADDYNSRRDCYKIGIAIESYDPSSVVRDIKEGVLGAMTVDGIEATFKFY